MTTTRRFFPVLRRVTAGLVLCAGACATTSSNKPEHSKKAVAHFVAAFEGALEAHDIELPAVAKTVADIRIVSRVRGLITACVPGKTPDVSISWTQDHAGRIAHTSVGDQTIGEISKRCQDMFDELEAKQIEACGARYVQVERKLGDDDAWAMPTVVKASQGWYMTPCDRPPGVALTDKDQALENIARPICEDAKASLYMLSKWNDDGDRRKLATVACITPRQARKGWLPGNPGLGVK